MTVSTPPGHGWRVALRRQQAPAVDGRTGGGYTDAFEIICRDCGDDPGLEYYDVPPGLQHIHGPYWIDTGVTEYEAHLAWHEALARGE